MACVALRATPSSSARRASSSATDGASSTSFWWRRWIEHSRSPSAIARVAVAQHLHLDVARAADVALEVDRGVAEAGLRLGARLRQQRRQAVEILDDLHAAPAAARRGLDDHRQADALDRLLGVAVGLDDAGAGQDGHAGRAHELPRRDLVAHAAHHLGLRADPVQAAALHHLGEVGVLGQEAVARVDRVGARDLGGADDAPGC